MWGVGEDSEITGHELHDTPEKGWADDGHVHQHSFA